MRKCLFCHSRSCYAREDSNLAAGGGRVALLFVRCFLYIGAPIAIARDEDDEAARQKIEQAMIALEAVADEAAHG